MMLANRGISGKYIWTDGTEFTYTGSYEKKFLAYLDKILQFPSSDLMAPAPQVFDYMFEGEQHAHIPDFYISSLNLIVNIKSSENKHYRLRDLDRELAEDNAIKKSEYNYIKIYDNQFSKFLDGMEKIKNSMENGEKKKVIIESFTDDSDGIGILLENLE